jgi:hypothetical protein
MRVCCVVLSWQHIHKPQEKKYNRKRQHCYELTNAKVGYQIHHFYELHFLKVKKNNGTNVLCKLVKLNLLLPGVLCS